MTRSNLFKKVTFLGALFFLLTSQFSQAQIGLSLRFLPDDGRYHVYLTPSVDPTGVNATLTDGSSQITIISNTGGSLLPTDIVTVGTATTWSLITAARNNGDIASGAPANTDFFVFGPSGNFNLAYQANQEIELFNFTVSGTCTGDLSFLPSANQTAAGGTLNIGSYYSVRGFVGGLGTNHFTTTYTMNAPCDTTTPVVCAPQAQVLSKN
ncbi:MAG: hypothetical protein ACK4UP_03620 [Spirosomataceae bacterium]